MDHVSLIRSTRFSAGHRYWRPEWSAEKNRRTFGASANPHGHNYRLEVTVRGRVDPSTGFCVDLVALDRALESVVERLDQQEIGEAVPEFAPGERIPSTEELARWLFHDLEARIPSPARLERVRLEESESLAAEYARECEDSPRASDPGSRGNSSESRPGGSS